MNKTALGIIHNRESERMVELAKIVALLRQSTHGASSTRSILDDGVFTEANQSPRKSKSRGGLAILFLQFMTYSKSTYLRYGLSKTFIYSVILGQLVELLRVIFIGRGKEINQRLYIDAELTAKHMRIWNSFNNSKYDFLIVIESDALLKSDSKYLLKEIQDAFKLKSLENSKGTYCDLAGGFLLSEIYGLNASKMCSDQIFKTHKLGFVNTTCAYLIDKNFVDLLLSYIEKKPLSKKLSVDSLMNRFLHSQSGRESQCLHPINLPFVHGSQLEKQGM